MPLIPFPDVPDVLGVPNLARLAGSAFVSQAVSLLTGDDPSILGLFQSAQWGVFDEDGNPVAVFDSVVSFDHAKEWRLSDYPIEDGGFETYNKVETPYDQRLTFAKGGPEAERSDFLDDIELAVASLDLFTVTTPEKTYTNANLVKYDFSRKANAGVTLLLVDLQIREVRVSANSAFSNTQDPAGAAPQNGGTVQPQAPSAPQAAAAANGAG